MGSCLMFNGNDSDSGWLLALKMVLLTAGLLGDGRLHLHDVNSVLDEQAELMSECSASHNLHKERHDKDNK